MDGDVVMFGVSRTKGKEIARARRRRSSSSSSEELPQPTRDSRKCFNCNQTGHIAARCPKPKCLGPKKARKVKKAAKPEESSNSSVIEELESSETEESSGKE